MRGSYRTPLFSPSKPAQLAEAPSAPWTTGREGYPTSGNGSSGTHPTPYATQSLDSLDSFFARIVLTNSSEIVRTAVLAHHRIITELMSATKAHAEAEKAYRNTPQPWYYATAYAIGEGLPWVYSLSLSERSQLSVLTDYINTKARVTLLAAQWEISLCSLWNIIKTLLVPLQYWDLVDEAEEAIHLMCPCCFPMSPSVRAILHSLYLTRIQLTTRTYQTSDNSPTVY